MKFLFAHRFKRKLFFLFSLYFSVSQIDWQKRRRKVSRICNNKRTTEINFKTIHSCEIIFNEQHRRIKLRMNAMWNTKYLSEIQMNYIWMTISEPRDRLNGAQNNEIKNRRKKLKPYGHDWQIHTVLCVRIRLKHTIEKLKRKQKTKKN